MTQRRCHAVTRAELLPLLALIDLAVRLVARIGVEPFPYAVEGSGKEKGEGGDLQRWFHGESLFKSMSYSHIGGLNGDEKTRADISSGWRVFPAPMARAGSLRTMEIGRC